MKINPVEIIRRKRDGHELSASEIQDFILSATKSEIPDYQVTAFLMATYFQGMTMKETAALTEAMICSGTRVIFSDKKPKIDKHSTGGVGDKVSLILSPLVACLGVDVPMVSGRGLGHTGGTLDKLECIPGFRIRLTIEEFKQLVEKSGMGMMGQTGDFVPADKLLYSLRDVTATVECIPLITASILSKKVAEGISGLVLDIKVGNGAFMKTQKDAEKLAKSILSVGRSLGLKIKVVLSDMNQPLGNAVGHTLEVLECIEVLEGKGPEDLRDVTLELAAHMLVLGEKATSKAAAKIMARKCLQNGAALEKFREMCRIQGANTDIVKNPQSLSVSNYRKEILAKKSGYITKIDTEALGMLLVRLGGGRQKASDTIDPSVGFRLCAKLGDFVEKNKPLVTLYYAPQKLKDQNISLNEVEARIDDSFCLSPRQAKVPELIKKVI